MYGPTSTNKVLITKILNGLIYLKTVKEITINVKYL